LSISCNATAMNGPSRSTLSHPVSKKPPAKRVRVSAGERVRTALREGRVREPVNDPEIKLEAIRRRAEHSFRPRTLGRAMRSNIATRLDLAGTLHYGRGRLTGGLVPCRKKLIVSTAASGRPPYHTHRCWAPFCKSTFNGWSGSRASHRSRTCPIWPTSARLLIATSRIVFSTAFSRRGKP